jgi:hypothetical protein
MRIQRVFTFALASALIVILSTVQTVRAVVPVQSEIDGLRVAYLNLVAGNHDYKGHRVKALKQVESAGQLLGLNLSGDGKARSAQKNSDTDLGAAKNALQGVLAAANANGQGQLSSKVNDAIKEINIALTIK